jgi:Beta-galactosidase jelly roll domain/Beta-galactosidase, domain 3
VGDLNELAVFTSAKVSKNSPQVKTTTANNAVIIRWTTIEADQFIQVGNLEIYLVDRISAYSMWVLSIPSGTSTKTPYTGTEQSSAILKGGYLMRTVTVEGSTLSITGDLNKTTELKIIGGAPSNLTALLFNSKPVSGFTQDSHGVVTATLELPAVNVTIPDLSQLKWKSIDSFPEIKPEYSDAAWTSGNLSASYNDRHPLRTPVSLYASDYGFHYGAILYRGTFKATGDEKNVTLSLRPGYGGAAMAYLNSTFVGSVAILGHGEMTLKFDMSGTVEAGKTYIITILLDNMGHNENWTVGEDEHKLPVGVMDYEVQGRVKGDVSWKIAGTFEGEDYLDRARGPTNEGGLWAERQGYHLPSPPSEDWPSITGPPKSLKQPGVTFWVTSFDLDMPKGYDTPLYIMVGNISNLDNTTGRPAYRLNFYINGWHFGKYVNDMGPQTKFPVPEGIWDYRGTNSLAVSAWNFEGESLQIDDIRLVHGPAIYSGMEEVKVVQSPKWSKRKGSF